MINVHILKLKVEDHNVFLTSFPLIFGNVTTPFYDKHDQESLIDLQRFWNLIMSNFLTHYETKNIFLCRNTFELVNDF
jgi:hypothetical protein